MNNFKQIVLVYAVIFSLLLSCHTKSNVVKREISNPEILYLLNRIDEIDSPPPGARLDRFGRGLYEQHSLVRWSVFARFQEIIAHQNPVMLFVSHDITTAGYEGSLWTPELTYDFRVIHLYADSLIISDGRPSVVQHEVKAILESDFEAIHEMQNELRNVHRGSFLSVYHIKRKDGEYHIELVRF